jgi:hypothetical protein
MRTDLAPDASSERSQLQAKLVTLKQQHASIGFGAEIAFLVIGIPALPLGVWMFATGIGGNDTAFGVLGLVIAAVALPLTLIGAFGLPAKAKRKGALSREIRSTEDQLKALDRRVDVFRLAAPVFALSSPVFTF